jgi:tRNA(Met) C34 N-acetyltransferase TmcA
MLTKQEIFNKAYAGLKAQGFQRAVRDAGPLAICQYRGRNGLKCAIGHLIPDENYCPTLEGKGAELLVVREAANIPLDVPISFLVDLQTCHDAGSSPEAMKRSLTVFSHQYNLKIED